MANKKIATWFSRIYTLGLCFFVCTLSVLSLTSQKYIISFRPGLVYQLVALCIFLVHIVLLIMIDDKITKIITAIMLIGLPFCLFALIAQSDIPEWISLLISTTALIVYSVILFVRVEKKVRFVLVIESVISFLPILIIGIVLSTSSPLEAKIKDESISPDGKIVIQTVENIHEGISDIKVNVCFNWYRDLGLLRFKLADENVYYTYSHQSIEIKWINNNIVYIMGSPYVRISDSQLVKQVGESPY